MRIKALAVALLATLGWTVSLHAELTNGTLLTYRGTFSADKADGKSSPQEFELQLLVSVPDEGRSQVLWMLNEQSNWSWLDRFGLFEVNGEGEVSGEQIPALLFPRGEVRDPVSVTTPFLAAPDTLNKGVSWTSDRLEFQVTGDRKSDIDDERRESWLVEVENNFGRKAVLAFDKDRRVINSLEEIVFLGQGEKHYLRYELSSVEPLAANVLADTLRQFNQLVELRQQIAFEPQTKELRLNREQLKTLQEKLPEIARIASQGPVTQLVQAAVEETKNGRGQEGALSAMKSKALGQSVDTQLDDLRGKKVAIGPGRTTILHFWDYRDLPLEEPYGQAAYLDFLKRRYDGKPLQVYGVVSTSLTEDASTRSKAVLSARKFHSFMNLSYPLVINDGELLKKLGDPRFAEASLPLFVVLDAEGKVIHYHVGYYEVDRVRGIAELDAVIEKALQTGE